MRGKVVRFDRRWWPLWLLLGLVLAGVALAIGLLVAVVWGIGRAFGAVARQFSPGSRARGGGLARRGE